MPVCLSCGAEMAADANFCLQCGHAAPVPVEPPATSQGPTSSEHPTIASPNDRFAGALAYLIVFGAAFLVLEPYNRNRFVRFHSFQALLATGTAVAGRIFLALLNAVFGVFGVFISIYTLLFFVLMVWLMIRAYQGERYKLPVLGEIAEKHA